MTSASTTELGSFAQSFSTASDEVGLQLSAPFASASLFAVIQTSDGQTLLDRPVQNLLSAMAANWQ